MTAIGGIGGIGGFAAAAAQATAPTAPVAGASSVGGGGIGGFGDAITGALDKLQQTQATADELAVKAATGDLQDAHEFMIAVTQASLATEMAVAVRNRAVEAFTSVMQMGV